MNQLETHPWNLSLIVTASTVLAACGPAAPGETDTASMTDTDPSPTTTSPSTTGQQCSGSNDCPPGFVCAGAMCMPEDPCASGGCCYDTACCYDTDCNDDPPCYSNEDCGPEGLCVSDNGFPYDCSTPYELPECARVPVVEVLDLPPLGEGQIVSLSFVDVDGDTARDLVVGRAGSAELHPGADAAPPVLLPVPMGASVVDAVSGDLDGDGDVDLVLSTLEGAVMTMFGDGAGGFTLAQEIPPFSVPVDLTLLQWDGDGMLDLVYADGQARLRRNDGMGGLDDRSITLDLRECISLAPLDYGSGQRDDLVAQHRVSSAVVYVGSSAGDEIHDAVLLGMPFDMRRMLTGRIDDSSPDEVIGTTPLAGRLLVELWVGAGGVPRRFWLTGDDTLAAMGDYDGDGVDDLVTAGASSISYVQGGIDEASLPTLFCRSPYVSSGPTTTLAVGDFDGNGRADVAVDDGGAPKVLLSQ